MYARQKDRNFIINARFHQIAEQQISALKESEERRVARVGGALPSVYAYKASCKTRAAVEPAFAQFPGVVVVFVVGFGRGIHCAHVRTIFHFVSVFTLASLLLSSLYLAT